jgi:murein DD-endopeptidase MepM/ murein hydrolase activator NlpD
MDVWSHTRAGSATDFPALMRDLGGSTPSGGRHRGRPGGPARRIVAKPLAPLADARVRAYRGFSVSRCRRTRPSSTLLAFGLALLVVVGLAFGGATLTSPLTADAATQQDLNKVKGKIGFTKSKLEKRRSRERKLQRDVQGYSARIAELQPRIDSLQQRQDGIQSDLDASEARLGKTQSDLRAERKRLVRLRAKLARSREVLAARLVELYQADKPSLVAVVVNSKGFADLLERGEFLNRIGQQDQRIVRSVKAARVEAIATEARLSKLEARQRTTNERIESRRDEVAQVKGRLVSARGTIAEARASRNKLLRSVRVDRKEIEEHLKGLQKEESKIQAKLSGMPSGGGVRQGSGNLVWPANAPITSPFGFRWGRLHGGIDLGVPTGTPVHAADDGTVAISGWVGGYGNYICIDHGGGFSTCYGHNSRLGVSVGQRVSKGQVIAASGNTGNSTGPHIHFETRVNGVQKDPMGYL